MQFKRSTDYSNTDRDCCSIPGFLVDRFETLEKWKEIFNEACCYHDDRYRGLISGSWNRDIADTLFYSDCLELARKYKGGDEILAFHAAKDMYEAVRLGGGSAWRKHRWTRYKNRVLLFGRQR